MGGYMPRAWTCTQCGKKNAFADGENASQCVGCAAEWTLLGEGYS